MAKHEAQNKEKKFKIFRFSILVLSFGFAQDGELAEPFRI